MYSERNYKKVPALTVFNKKFYIQYLCKIQNYVVPMVKMWQLEQRISILGLKCTTFLIKYFEFFLRYTRIKSCIFRSEMSESPKRSISMGSPSPTREQKARLAVAEATASANSMQSKWKMQIGAATSGSSRFKKKPEREDYLDERETVDKRLSKNGDLEPRKGGRGGSPEKNMSVRKAMAMKEQPKKPPEPEPVKKPKPPPPAPAPKPLIPQGPVVLDKFGNFRLMTPPKDTKLHGDDMPPLPPGAPPKHSFSGTIHILTKM